MTRMSKHTGSSNQTRHEEKYKLEINVEYWIETLVVKNLCCLNIHQFITSTISAEWRQVSSDSRVLIITLNWTTLRVVTPSRSKVD